MNDLLLPRQHADRDGLAVRVGRDERRSPPVGAEEEVVEPEDRIDPGTSNLKYQSGVSAAFSHRVSDNLVVALDYFLFRTDWWGAPIVTTDANGNPVAVGMLPAEKQVVHFINLVATFHW